VFRVDTTAPTTTASATSPPDSTAYTFNTWTKNNVKVTLSAFDSGVGFNPLTFPVYCTDTPELASLTEKFKARPEEML